MSAEKADWDSFKRQFAGWLAYHDVGDMSKVWRERADWPSTSMPDWVHAIIYIEECELFGVFNMYCDPEFAVLLQTQFDELMQKHGVWWEMENCCVIWLYDPSLLEQPANG